MKKEFLIFALITVCLLSACQKDNGALPTVNQTQGEQTEGQTNQEQGKDDDPNQETNNQTDKTRLFDLKEFDGTKEITLHWGDQQSTAQFIKAPYLPFGLYIPDKMETIKFSDGEEWGYDNNRISLLEYYDTYTSDLNSQNPELQKYEEYAGSTKWDGPDQVKVKFEDYFVLEQGGQKYVVRLSYSEDETKTALPMFLEVLKNLKSVSE
ncbi:hypothetical protein [Paenibacillus pinihumi]|uniref:hypothetical protein n=1 Tax=Paenibacillus pinihumi TaxID=669462 RepID=UPI0003F8D1DD|nr:hypothetical protein [Paenibacillus pinihumi]